jgi:iron complex transport system substrate-binding protein
VDHSPAAGLRAELQERLDRVRDAVTGTERPRVAALEWLERQVTG